MNKKGFTLVELLAVIVILAVVMLIAVTSVGPMMEKSRKSALGSEGISLIKASDDVFTEESLKGPKAEYSTTSSVCYDIKYLCEHGSFEKGCEGDGYTGSILAKYVGNGKKEYYFWISNGTYVYNAATIDTYGNFDDDSILYDGTLASTDCGKTDPEGITDSAKTKNESFKNQSYVYVNSISITTGSESTLAAGFYDADDNLVVSWEDSGIDVSIDYTTSTFFSLSTSGYNVTSKYPNATKVVIPNTITKIGSNAFSLCYYLEQIIIPESVTSIGESAFSACVALKSITIPKGVTVLSDNMFDMCLDLETVNILGNVTSLGKAFHGASGIKHFDIPSGVTKIEDQAFQGTGIKSVTIPSTVTSIGGQAFTGSGLTELVIPEGVTTIKYLAFEDSRSLKKVVLPDSLTSISTQVFMNCSALEEITIPHGVTSLPMGTFCDCKSLRSITYKGTKAEWNSISKGQDWKHNVPTSCVVHCTDGDITI